MKILRITSLYLLSILCLTACYDNVDDSIVLDTQTIDTPILITTAITGSVVDSDDNALIGYSISVGNLLENIEGKRFLLQIEDVNKNGQAIYVKNGNQINSILHTPLIENDINLVTLQMFDPINSSAISSSGQNLIEISPNISLQVDAEEIIDDQGNIPTQETYVDHRDLSNLNNISQLGVSSYNIRDQLRSTKHLQAFQMILRGADGTLYNIADKINLSITVPSSNEDVSLFHFDVEDERWVEIVDLTTGNNEVAIDKTGLFTISEHTKAIYAEGDVNKEGVNVSYQSISLAEQRLHSTAGGRWISIIAANKETTLTTITPCENAISSYSIPASDMNISNVDIEVTTDNYYKLRTKVYDCDGKLEETTSIYFKDETNVGNIYTFADKNLDIWVSVCNEEFDLSTYDIDTDLKGPAIPWSLDIEEDQNFLVSCDQYQDGYSYIKILDDRRVLPPFDATKVAGSTTLHSSDQDIRFKFAGQMADNYQMEDVNVYLRQEQFGDNGYLIQCENSDLGCGFTTWNVTHYEAGSEKWVRVSFAGEVWMQTIDPPQAGFFPVEGVILTKAE